jgi:hypothetical protein
VFHTLKKALISVPVIQPPDWHLPFEIMCDASDYSVGAVLGQSKDKKQYAISSLEVAGKDLSEVIQTINDVSWQMIQVTNGNAGTRG